MKLSELLDRLAEDQAQAMRYRLHPDDFVRRGERMVHHEAESEADEDAALDHLRSLAESIPVPLEDIGTRLDEAHRICRAVERRLSASPGVAAFIDQWPAPVAHELQSLIDALQGRSLGSGSRHVSPEAALLQLRDLGESMMRLPVVALCAAVMEHGGAPAQDCAQALLGVSGGGWLTLGGQAARWLLAADRKHPLAALAALYQPAAKVHQGLNSLVAGRNDYIGHAGVRPDPVETAEIIRWHCLPDAAQPQCLAGEAVGAAPRRPALPLLPLLEQAAAPSPWQGLALEMRLPSGEPRALMGARALQGWMDDPHCHHHDGQALPLQLRLPGGSLLPLSPWVSARQCHHCGRRDVFVFDNWYQHDKADLQDYGRGHKLRLPLASDPPLSEWRQQALAAGQREPAPKATAELGTLDSGATLALLDRHSLARRYSSPAYLRDGLRDFLATQRQGIYWLQAPAHVGKTLFSQGLADAALEPDGLAVPAADGQVRRWVARRSTARDECGVAAFLCKKAYRESGQGFLNAIGPALVQALDIARERASLLPAAQTVALASPAQRGQAFAQFIEGHRALSAQPGQPLLIVIDGLDEAEGPASPDSLFHLLPRPSDLSAGVHLLLTSRRVGDADCPTWLGPALARLRPPGLPVGAAQAPGWCCRVLDLADAGYRALMRRHVQDQLGRHVEADPMLDQAFAQMLQAAQGLFIYVSFIAERVRLRQLRLEELAGLPHGEQLYARYLDELPLRHGPKLAEGLYQVLATLAAAEQAHEWLFTPEGEVSDISQLPDDARAAWIQALMQGNAPRRVEGAPPLPMADREWPGLDLQVLAELMAADQAGGAGPRLLDARLVLLLILVQGTLGVWRGEGGRARYRLGLKGFGEQIRQHPALRERVHRQTLTLVQWLNDALAAWAAADAGSPAEAACERVLKPILPLLPGAAALGGGPAAAVASWARAELACAIWWQASHHQQHHAEGARLARMQLQVALSSHWPVSPPDRTRLVAMGWGNLGHSLEQHRQELSSAVRAITVQAALTELLCESLGPECPVDLRNDVATAYMNRGTALWRSSALSEAINDYRVSIELMEGTREQLGEQWPPESCNRLAMAYMNRGNAHRDRNAPSEAMEDYGEAIDLLEGLREELGEQWPPQFYKGLAAAYTNRGLLRHDRNAMSEAIEDYGAAIQLMMGLREQRAERWQPELRNALAGAYANRGNALQDCNALREAIEDYGRAIELMEGLRAQLGEQWPPQFRNDLAGVYSSKGNALNRSHALIEAIADYGVAIELREDLREQLGEQWPPQFRNKLAGAYMDRGNAQLRRDALNEAIEDYGEAIELREDLREQLGEQWPPQFRNDLAAAYMNRGNALARSNALGEAIEDYGVAIELMEGLREELGEQWPPQFRNDLAGAYMNRGNAQQGRNALGEAIEDYGVAIELMEGLREQLGEQWPPQFRNDLAGAYMNRGNAQQGRNALGEAIEDYGVAIELMEGLREQLGEQWPPQFRNDLAGAYMNRGNAQQGRNALGEAIEDYGVAIELMEGLREQLGEQWPPSFKEGLRRAYANRASARAATGDADGAKADESAASALQGLPAVPRWWFAVPAGAAAQLQRMLAADVADADRSLGDAALAALVQLCPLLLPAWQAKALKVRALSLTCWPGGWLLQCMRHDTPQPRHANLLWRAEGLLWLDGSAEPLHAARTMGWVRWQSQPQAAEWLMLFWLHARGELGPFLPVERSADLPWRVSPASRPRFRQAPLRAVGAADGGWQLSAQVLYGDELFQCEYAIAADGTITIASAERMASGLPVLRLQIEEGWQWWA